MTGALEPDRMTAGMTHHDLDQVVTVVGPIQQWQQTPVERRAETSGNNSDRVSRPPAVATRRSADQQISWGSPISKAFGALLTHQQGLSERPIDGQVQILLQHNPITTCGYCGNTVIGPDPQRRPQDYWPP